MARNGNRRNRLAARAAAAFLAWSAAIAPMERAHALVADMSDHLIAITTAFSGADLLLFGAVRDPKADVVAVVTGPSADVTVWKKNRVAGIWINDEQVTFQDTPTYYAIAADRPLDEIAGEHTRDRHLIGVDTVRPALAPGQPPFDDAHVATFRDAMVRRRQAEGLYGDEPVVLRRIGPNLFRADVQFPAHVQPGSYTIEVFEFVDGYVTAAQSSTLSISKVGLEADIYDFARDQPALYGLSAIGVAVFAGWAASVAFRRS